MTETGKILDKIYAKMIDKITSSLPYEADRCQAYIMGISDAISVLNKYRLKEAEKLMERKYQIL